MPFFADYHTHTIYSGDSESPMEDMILQAASMGLQELVFTDHVDFDYADPAFESIDYDEYLSVFLDLQAKYNNQLRLLMGVEVGYQPHIQTRLEEFLKKYPFDFVICSTHMADRLDFYTGDFFTGKEQKAAYLRYFENVLYSIKHFRDYDVYGHLDFIVRYGDYAKKVLSYHDYQDILDEILKQSIFKGHGIEVNTSGFRYGLEQMHPQFAIIKRFHELGGEIITVGSDAHQPQDLCSHFSLAYQLLKKAGFTHMAAFEGRQARFHPIP